MYSADDFGTSRPVPKSTQMALSSQPGTPDIQRALRLEQAEDEVMCRGERVESLLDQDSDAEIRRVAGRKIKSKRRLTGLLRMASKDRCCVALQSAPMSSDDEMETSFSSYKTTTEKGMSNPVYDAGADSSDTELPRYEDGLKSKEKEERRRVPEIRARDDVDNSDSTKLEDEKISSLHAQTAVPVSPTTIAEDATVEATKESENQGTGQAE
ncbi:uncharacterized protein LOC110069582 [Orbicella faveolata]|uniref:uncharacterized protein LOC110069582 n=1 Tax=Orbicella faveolata TaxID=48498 RepID=UPI0009E49849|nr:uncharacterized protein LOC110069582 [Orbicella faveolata]